MAFDIKAALAKIQANPQDSGDPRGAGGYWTGGGGDGGMGEYTPYIPFSKTGSYFNEGMALTPLGDGTYAVYQPAEPGKASRLNGQTYQIVDAGGNVVGQNVWRGITDQNPEQQFAIAGSMMALPMALTAAGVAGAAGGAGAGAAGGAGAGAGAVEAGTMASGVTIGGPMSVGGAAGTALPSMGAMGGMGAGAAGVGAAAGGGGGAAGAGGAAGGGGILGQMGSAAGSFDWKSLIGPALSAAGGVAGANAAGDAADAQLQATREAAALQEPFRQGGMAAMNRLLEVNGIGGNPASEGYGSAQKDFTAADFAAGMDPGYAWRQQQGQLGLERAASAKGGLGSGGYLKDAMAYNSGLASQEYQAAFDRNQVNRTSRLNPLQSLMGAGQTAANTIGGYTTQGGDAQAAGAIGKTNALTGALSQGFSMYTGQQNRLYEQGLMDRYLQTRGA